MAHAEKADRRARGQAVEAAALRYLQQQGLALVARNASARVGELDLVMRDPGHLVFVEVRYRADARHGDGAESVHAGKQRKLARAALAFLQRHPELAALPCRFDVVAASGDPAAPGLHWIRDAFRPEPD